MRQFLERILLVQAAASVNSAAIPAVNIVCISVQLVATGSAAGTLKLQASNDILTAGNSVPTNWTDIANATVDVSGAGAYLIPKTDVSYEYVRAVYTNSGTGTITAVLKALGA